MAQPDAGWSEPRPAIAPTIWFTGLPCSGKSTLALQIAAELSARRHKIEILDGDALRNSLCRDLTFSRADRRENLNRIGWVCTRLGRHDVISIVAAIAPYREDRDRLKESIANFVEVYVKAPLDTCVQRDTKGLYAKALRGQIIGFTGVDSPYEEPQKPDVVVDTHRYDERTSCEIVLHWLEKNNLIRCREVSQARENG